jgi:hypothetical protein
VLIHSKNADWPDVRIVSDYIRRLWRAVPETERMMRMAVWSEPRRVEVIASIAELPSTVVRMVAPGYFRTLRIPVVRGRESTDADNENPMGGFVVNETFARRYLSGRDPLPTSISVRMQDENPYVVGDVSEGSVRVAPKPTVFYSHGLMPWPTMTLFVRGGQPELLVKAVTAALREFDPTLVVSDVRTLWNSRQAPITSWRVMFFGRLTTR